MAAVKIFGPMRIDSGPAGAEATIRVPIRKVGASYKACNYGLRVDASSGANVRLTVEVVHGPDGSVTTTHSTPINAGDPTTTLPSLLSGDTDSTKILGDYLAVNIKIKDVALTTIQWAVVTLFETGKPF